MTNSIAVKGETPLTVLARAEAQSIVADLLRQVQESGKGLELSDLFITLAASTYLSGFVNGMALALVNADKADLLISAHLTPEQSEVTWSNMRSFLHQLAEMTG